MLCKWQRVRCFARLHSERGSAGLPGAEAHMPKQMAFDVEARDRLRAGVDKIARAVGSTLGPKGRNAILDKSWGGPAITKDGVTVADDIELSDPYENMGAQLVREAATR